MKKVFKVILRVVLSIVIPITVVLLAAGFIALTDIYGDWFLGAFVLACVISVFVTMYKSMGSWSLFKSKDICTKETDSPKNLKF